MNAPAHTPGPWAVNEFGQIKAERLPVASVHFFPEWKENARLIAAAPDLLAALYRICEISPEDPGMCNDYALCLDAVQKIAAQTVTKATGGAV